jgi:hypothetical protein
MECRRPPCARSDPLRKIARDGHGRLTGHVSRFGKLPLGASCAVLPHARLSPDATLFGPSGRSSLSPTARRAPHQFRARNHLAKTQRARSTSDENAGKSLKLTFTLPLITVWLQVRVLPGPPMKSIAYQVFFRRPVEPPHQKCLARRSLADGNRMFHIRSGYDFSFFIVDLAALSHEKAKQHPVLLSSNGPSTVAYVSRTRKRYPVAEPWLGQRNCIQT